MASIEVEHVHTYLHIRSKDDMQKKKRDRLFQILNDKHVHLNQQHGKDFMFDKVFDENTPHEKVYATVVSPLLLRVMQGYSCYFFMYGPPDTGKNEALFGDMTNGYVPRALGEILDKKLRLGFDMEATIQVSYFGICNEELYDFLENDTLESREGCFLWINDDPEQKGSVYISNLTAKTIFVKNDIEKLMTKAEDSSIYNKLVEDGEMSKAHRIFTVLVHVRSTEKGQDVINTGKLSFIQLADCDVNTLDRNYSMETFWRMVKALQERDSYVPYKDSKLTRVVQEAFGGRGKTAFVINVRPTFAQCQNTLAALDLSKGLRSVINKPVINKITSRQNIINRMKEDIKKLQKDLEASRSRKGFLVDAENYEEMKREADEHENEIAKLNASSLDLKYDVNILQEQKSILKEKAHSVNDSFRSTRKRALGHKSKLFQGEKQLKRERVLTESQEQRVSEIEKQTEELTAIVSASTHHLNVIREKACYLHEKFLENRESSFIICQLLQEATSKALIKNADVKTNQNNIAVQAKAISLEIMQCSFTFLSRIKEYCEKIKALYCELLKAKEGAKVNVSSLDFTVEHLKDVLKKHHDAMNIIRENIREMNQRDLLNHINLYEDKFTILEINSAVSDGQKEQSEIMKNILEASASFVNDVQARMTSLKKNTADYYDCLEASQKLLEGAKTRSVTSDINMQEMEEISHGQNVFIQGRFDTNKKYELDIMKTISDIENCKDKVQEKIQDKAVKIFKDSLENISLEINEKKKVLEETCADEARSSETNCVKVFEKYNVHLDLGKKVNALEPPKIIPAIQKHCQQLETDCDEYQGKNINYHSKVHEILHELNELASKMINTNETIECHVNFADHPHAVSESTTLTRVAHLEQVKELKKKIERLQLLNKENLPINKSLL